MLIVISTAITYTVINTNQITQLAETVQIKQTSDVEKISEEFQIDTMSVDDNQFNMTLTNTGNVPVHITRLWVENTTDSTWPLAKFELNYLLAPGNTTRNIGQDIGLAALDSQSYLLKFVTDRGNTERAFINSVGDADSVFVNLRASPTTVSDTFTTTLVLEVINIGTKQLLNLQPDIAVVPSSPTCTPLDVTSDPIVPFDSLAPGNIATFEWVYRMNCPDAADSALFTASLIGSTVSDSVTVTVQPVTLAQNSEVTLQDVAIGSLFLKNMLIFHAETFDVPEANPPNVSYQMYSASPDIGVDGVNVPMDAVLLSSFFMQNATTIITVSEGKWNASMTMVHDPLPSTLRDSGADMLFHFEDNVAGNPDNSQGSSARDLANCGGIQILPTISITSDNDDAEE